MWGRLAYAFDPATDHTCVAYCGGGSAPSGGGGGGGGGGVAPSPTPSQLGHVYNQQAVAASYRGDWETAVRLLRIALSHDPTDPQIRKNLQHALGELANRRGVNAADRLHDYDAAIRFYEEALRSDPSNSQIKHNLAIARGNLENNRGLAALNSKQWDIAIEYFEKARRTVGYNASVDGNLNLAHAGEFDSKGRAALARGDYDAGIEDYHQAMAALEKAIKAFRAKNDPSAQHSIKDALASVDWVKGQLQQAKERKLAAQVKKPEAGDADVRHSFPEGGALGQAKAANETSKAGAAESGHESMTVPGGPNERASSHAGEAFDSGIAVPAHGNSFAVGSTTNDSSPFVIPGWSPEKMAKLAGTPAGRDVIEAEKKWRGALNQSNEKINAITAKIPTASVDEKKKLLDDWTAELNAQTEMNRKLTDLDQQAGQIVVNVQLDK